jgi:hypothetical protein
MKQIAAKEYLTALMILATPFFTIGLAEAEVSGLIRGKLINQSLNQKGVENLEVKLYQFFEDKASDISRIRTDKTGLFVFEGINSDKDRAYYTSVRYKKVDYFSQMLNFAKDTNINLDLTVFEPTHQAKDIHTKMHHIVVENFNDALEFKEIMIVENKGNKVYVGDRNFKSSRNATLRISLPKETDNVQLLSPSLIKSGAGLIDTSEIMPGTKKIMFSYRINSARSYYKFEKDFHLNTDKFNIIVPENGIKVRSDQLEIRGPAENSGKRFYYLSGENLSAGSQVVLELALSTANNLFKWDIIGLVAFVFGTAFTYKFMRGRKHRQDNEEQKGAEPERISDDMNLIDERLKVLQAIAELDDQQDLGAINPQELNRKRRVLKQRAVEITKILQSRDK